MTGHHFLAIDLGAESGKAVAGIIDNKKLLLKEVHRFPTGMLEMDNHLYWNIYRFFEEIITAINLCVHKEKIKPLSLAIDTWGVDFGFLGKDGTLNRIPYAYRDPQSASAKDKFLKEVMSPEKIYELTGIAIQVYNSVFQLFALKNNSDTALSNATKLLFLPDIINYFLTGKIYTEFTFATTSQLFNPKKGLWEEEIFKALDMETSLMAPVIRPGQKIAMLKEDIARIAGVKPFLITSVCSHDTASAIAAIPAQGTEWAYISSGTWSLMGVELTIPLINEKTYKYNFTNEGGVDGTYRFLKNIMGLWLLQQCRQEWTKTGYTASYAELTETAKNAHPFKCFIDPDHPGFYNPEKMPLAIDEYCIQTGQEPPETVGEYTRTILEALAFKYKMVLDQLVETTGKKIKRIHITGGGTQNKMLCQFTANVTGLQVIAGPAEGTAIGNILVQAKAMGVIKGLDDMRKMVWNSFSFESYYPEDTKTWKEAYEKFLEKTNNT